VGGISGDIDNVGLASVASAASPARASQYISTRRLAPTSTPRKLTTFNPAMPLLSVSDLRTHFHTRSGVYRAVDGVSFAVERGETLGIVGESGSGKSVTCYSLMGLIPQPPGRIVGGSAVFDGVDLLACPPAQLRAIRGKRVSMIFQDPMTSLNPYLRIGEQLIEPLLIHEKISKADALRRALAMLEAVGINDAAKRLHAYPHEFSGGMRQRVMIAMALITKPELLIADEPTTALDVTVQAQILELIKKMQRELGMAVVFITHDLGVVSGLCDRVLVMYAGRVVESADVRTLFYQPKHPYTRALQRSIPALQPKGHELYTIPGLPPDVSKPISGCAFAPRCEHATDLCRQRDPALVALTPTHAQACLRVQAGAL
jgi:oligopeptide transport system ATP-binding protein